MTTAMISVLLIVQLSAIHCRATSIAAVTIDHLELQNDNALELAKKINLPMGLEMTSISDPRSRKGRKLNAAVTMVISNMTAAQALDLICKKTDSSWVEDRGVISIRPNQRNAVAEYFLNKRVDVDSLNQSHDDIIESIFNSWRINDPAVQVSTTSLGIKIKRENSELLIAENKKIADTGLTGRKPRVFDRYTMPLKAKTLREVLNTLASAEHAVWSGYSEVGGTGMFVQFGELPRSTSK